MFNKYRRGIKGLDDYLIRIMKNRTSQVQGVWRRIDLVVIEYLFLFIPWEGAVQNVNTD